MLKKQNFFPHISASGFFLTELQKELKVSNLLKINDNLMLILKKCILNNVYILHNEQRKNKWHPTKKNINLLHEENASVWPCVESIRCYQASTFSIHLKNKSLFYVACQYTTNNQSINLLIIRSINQLPNQWPLKQAFQSNNSSNQSTKP